MRSFTYREHVNRTPEQLFTFMTDFSKMPTWRSLVRRIEVVGGGPLRRGGQVLITMEVMGKVRRMTSDVWSYDPPTRIGFMNTESNVTGVFEYMLEPARGGTDVTFTCDVTPHGFMWLLLPFLLKSNRARYVEQLGRLKRAAEKDA